MSGGYSVPAREDDPVHTVRTIGRLCQIILELREEYVQRPRAEILTQIEQRLDDLQAQHAILKERIAHAADHEFDDLYEDPATG